jgi:hypothetical protein
LGREKGTEKKKKKSLNANESKSVSVQRYFSEGKEEKLFFIMHNSNQLAVKTPSVENQKFIARSPFSQPSKLRKLM